MPFYFFACTLFRSPLFKSRYRLSLAGGTLFVRPSFHGFSPEDLKHIAEKSIFVVGTCVSN
jgi:hypothetical protein